VNLCKIQEIDFEKSSSMTIFEVIERSQDDTKNLTTKCNSCSPVCSACSACKTTFQNTFHFFLIGPDMGIWIVPNSIVISFQ